MNSRFLKPILLILSVLLSQTGFSRELTDQQSRGSGRMAAPATLACDRNELTSFNGTVSHYQRGTDVTVITILTDWDTVETVTLEHSDSDGVMQYFKLRGQAFTYSDWTEIESEPGVLHDGVRVIAWVCLDDKTPPVIDWQP